MSPWHKEIFTLTLLLGLFAIIGLINDAAALWLLIALALYLGWHIYNISRLVTWLGKPGKFQPPEGRGIWSEIFERIYALQRKNRERKKKLAKYINRFRESTAAMPDATIVLNRHDQIEWLNKAAQESLGLQPAKDIGQHISNLLRHPGFIHYLQRRQYDTPLEIPSPVDEQCLLNLRVIPYGQNQRLLIARDVTRIRRLEQMRRDFVSNISHELRTPLTVIHGYLETMQDESGTPIAEWHDTINLMLNQSNRMRDIVDDLLMLSRMENEQAKPESFELVPVPSLLHTIHEAALALGTEKQQQITLECDNQLTLSGVANELYSAFSNLVFNAVRYTPDGGRITIRWYSDDDGAHFEVRDTGIGIPPQHIARLTERFFRVDAGRSRQAGGTGLGLAIVKHVLERHQATLHIESRINQGSTFRCDFPPAMTASEERASAASADSA